MDYGFVVRHNGHVITWNDYTASFAVTEDGAVNVSAKKTGFKNVEEAKAWIDKSLKEKFGKVFGLVMHYNGKSRNVCVTSILDDGKECWVTDVETRNRQKMQVHNIIEPTLEAVKMAAEMDAMIDASAKALKRAGEIEQEMRRKFTFTTETLRAKGMVDAKASDKAG